MQSNQKPLSLSFSPIVLILPFFLWGTAMVAMKDIITETTPFFLGGFRILPAGILVLLFAIFQRKSQPQSLKAWAWIFLFALVDGAMFQGFLAWGLQRTGAGLGSVMIDSQPLMVAVLCRWLFKDVIGLWGWLGLSLGILGISLIGLPDVWIADLLHGNWHNLAFDDQDLLNNGEWWMLLASVSMAVGTVMIPFVCRHADAVVATGWHLIFGGLILFALSALHESSQWVNLDLGGWLSLSYATILGGAVAYGLFFYLASQGNITNLSALTFLTPVFALTFGNLWLGETLSLLQWLGVSFTLVSIYLINQRKVISSFLKQF